MKNNKTLSTMLTLSMFISAIPALAREEAPANTSNPQQQQPQQQQQQQQQPQQPQEQAPNSQNTNETKPEETNTSILNKFTKKFGKFWTQADTPTKVITGTGIAFGALLTGFVLKKIFNFIPETCNYLTAIGGTVLTFMGINHLANKPENKEIVNKVKQEVSTAFESMKNMFSNLFSKKESME